MLMTPDFRLQLISPGTFHFAISVAPAGDTCLRSLAGNDASVFISETMGTDSYQLSPGKSVMFRAGKISGATEAPAACGCPEMKQEMMVAQAARSGGPGESGGRARKTAAGAESNADHLAGHPWLTWRWTALSFTEVMQAVQDYYGAVARLSLSTDNSKLALALLPQVSGPAAEAKAAAKKEGSAAPLAQISGTGCSVTKVESGGDRGRD